MCVCVFVCAAMGNRSRTKQFIMVLIREYRVPLPMTVEEYQRAQLYAVAKMSDSESGGGGAGVEIIKNESYKSERTGKRGQYTKKIYHLGTRVPGQRAVRPCASPVCTIREGG